MAVTGPAKAAGNRMIAYSLRPALHYQDVIIRPRVSLTCPAFSAPA